MKCGEKVPASTRDRLGRVNVTCTAFFLRTVAQFVSVFDLGSKGRRLKSYLSDQAHKVE